jgi:type IV pilus biogenesis protein PilP
VVAWAFRAGLALAVSAAGAQTIADYSRAQRALLESTMVQAAARSAGLAASAPASAALAPAPPPASRPAPRPAAPSVRVGGVFAHADGIVAEVIVDATAYLLGAGQGVPGTTWQVESIDVDRVVLGRHVATAGDAEGARKVFALPTLR